MDAKTSAALEASIKHWQENVVAETPEQASVYGDDCALCQTFDCCIGCPVAAATGEDQCGGSPYYEAQITHRAWNGGYSDHKPWRKAAQAELDFLISLRKEAA